MEVSDNTTKGNDRYYGYCIDLLKEIVNQSEFKFDYTIYLAPDGLYGHKSENGEWNGMIGELVRKVGFDRMFTLGVYLFVLRRKQTSPSVRFR